VQRRKVALRLLLREAGLLAAVLGVFAVVSYGLAGGGSSVPMISVGVGVMLVLFLAEWVRVQSKWKRLRDDYGGGYRALQAYRRKH